ncbi:error-prone DNA polymerase [Treponema primitia ZAS-2]|uniref:DNA-directed DNA polymerase n=1 Tax=Treponema primitia (strain ATCC BAA-887 / DSM 12427 / ZAS-2) TaxID=545694 RepID=F5YJV2_TREPZ|nr:DNA polymerase III subunit alpha [Treponema primitia]AEF85201.1 error-prone DNA polymerase [Treponema primitia ZAS-2]
MLERLGLCSAYSLLYGVRRPEDLIQAVKTCGTDTVSFTDRDNLYGLPVILEKSKEMGVRPIIGACLTVPDKGLVYCFVRDRRGYSRLCELLTMRNRDTENYKPVSLLRQNSAGLILASSDEIILEALAGRTKALYGAITPDSLGAIGPCRRLGIPLAFLDTALFLEKEDYPVHRALRAIGLGKTVGNLGEGDTVKKDGHLLLSDAALEGRLRSWPEAVKGTKEISAACVYHELFEDWIFPGYTTELSPGEELYSRVLEGAAARYGELGDAELGRIEYELGIINSKGFAPYFLVMDDIVRMASRTCGRGSGAASIVSYSLGITNVDPLAHKLYFERFLNPARPDPPDIDVDFAWDERDDLIKRVIERFGPEHCARVANHNMFRPRSAFREAAKAYGFGDAEISQIEKQLFHFGDKSGVSDPLWVEILGIAKKIEGLPRGLSMHCGGLVITPERIDRYVPIESSLDGYPLLSWEKDGTESAGFVKIDLLGNRSLAVIRDALANLGEQGIAIDRDTWRPIEDGPTVAALARGDSMGVFYIESPAMRQLQKKTGAGDFAHIVIHSSIIRPAANKFINEYVRRLKGGEWAPLHPRLAYILDETYGILCYQEDVSKTAVALAGFDEVEADKLRKVIAKKAGVKLAVYEKQFFEGCRKNGVADEVIQKIWEMMLSFDGYSFCKPHSASYAMVSFQSAYLRVHHPGEFMAAVLSNQGGYYRPHAYIAECRRMGLIVEGPDVNTSRWRYYGMGKRVVVGLMAVKGLSASGGAAIVAEREKGGEFRSMADFLRRVRLDRDDVIALCPAGVFDGIAGGLPRALQARELLKAHTGAGRKGQDELFAAEITPVYRAGGAAVLAPAPVKQKTGDEELWEEYRALGFLRGLHPLALWKDKIRGLRRVKGRYVGEYIGQQVCLLGWPVTQKEVWTKDGLAMSFLTFEDETALYETVIFPGVYERYGRLLFDQAPLLVYGRVCEDNGAVSVEVGRVVGV